MSMVMIDSLDDARLDPYRNLKDRELAALDGRFIAEGEHVVRRLLASDFPVDSVLLARRRVEELGPLVPEGVPVFAVTDEVVEQVIGFAFHSGVLACGRRKPAPTLDSILPPPGDTTRPLTLMVCPEIINAENIGTLIRIGAAFGVDAMLIGERSCDPFWRRSIRVSMGTVFRLPLLHSRDLLADLKLLKERWKFDFAATVLDADAQPLATAGRAGVAGGPDRLALFFGSESQGLHRRWLAVCDRKLTIPMHMGTDSLNVAIAAAVFLFHFTKSMNPSDGTAGASRGG